MKSNLVFLFLLAVATNLGVVTALGQSNEDKIPSGPLLASAPDLSRWVVTYTYPEDNPKNLLTGSPPPAGASTRTRTVMTTKAHDVIHEEFVDATGAKFDEWHVGSSLYIKGSGSGLWGEIDSGNGDLRTAHVEQLPANGFRNLDWITKDHYLGMIKYSARTCLLFTQGTSSTKPVSADLSQEQIEAMNSFAIIDADTRLPVRVRSGGMTRLYSFMSPPDRTLALPPDLQDQLKKGDEGRTRLNSPMPRPY